MRGLNFTAAMGVLAIAPSLLQASPLLQTHWDQRDEYAMYAPRQERLGCWSTALAQIL